jgi:acyl-coenzyme A synthetase/AMP-(fatty) acid ligase/acyl carrier protein
MGSPLEVIANTSIPARFAQIVQAIPDGIAVMDGTDRMTYACLNQRTNQVAHLLRQFSIQGNSPVAIFCVSTQSSLIALLGIWKLGRLAVILDLATAPAERHAILTKVGCSLILCDDEGRDAISSDRMSAITTLNVERDTTSLPVNDLGLDISPDANAVLLLTSGSTGQPKGIIRNQRMLLFHVLCECERMGVVYGEVLTSFYPMHHAAALNDLLRALLSGATLALYDLPKYGVHPLARWLVETQAAALRMQTPTLRAFLDTLPEGFTFPQLRYVRPSSRTLRTDVERLFSHLPPHAVIGHTLGSTETGQIAGWVFDRTTVWEGEVVPVGSPLDGMEVTLRSDDDEIIEGEGVGVLEVRSAYLAQGYWSLSTGELSAFQTDPLDSRYRLLRTSDRLRRRADGMLEWVGRVDKRVKMRGLNVDTAHVEWALHDIELVSQAVVEISEEADTGLIAYIVPRSQECSISYLREQMSRRLPGYAIPLKLIFLPEMPLLSSGKIDRKSLPPPGTGRPLLATSFVPPSTRFESILAAIWSAVLGLDAIGIYDPFLDLGGNSLQAMRIAARVAEEFGVEIPLAELFVASTVAETALLLIQQLTTQVAAVEFERVLEAIEVL